MLRPPHAVMFFSCPLGTRGGPAEPAEGRSPPRPPAAAIARLRISQPCEHVGRPRQLAFRVTIALLFRAYSDCGPFLYKYTQAPTDLSKQMLAGNSATSYRNLVFKFFTIPTCNR